MNNFFGMMHPVNAYNLTDAVGVVDSFGPDFIQFIFMSVLYAAGSVNQECWLKFPLNCFGCKYSNMNVKALDQELGSALNLFQSVCDVIYGQPSFKPVLPVIVDDEILLKQLKQSALYEPEIRPNFPNKPEIVIVSFRLISVENLDPADSSFRIDCYLQQEWFDHRLRHPYFATYVDLNTEDTGLWYPDTYFVQSRYGVFNHRTNGISVTVRSDGKVEMNLRMTIKVSCSMDFHSFPMDVQKCKLNMESYSHDTSDVQYKWREDQYSTKYYKSQVLSLYDLKPLKISERTISYILGNWSTLELEFVFVRNSIIFIPALYFPCAIIVIISWITFVLESNHYPARTYLCVTAMLTILTVQAAMDTNIPKVSYVKAIDRYVLVCIFFISASFCEYAFVLIIRYKRQLFVIKRNERIKIYERVRKKLQRSKKNILPTNVKKCTGMNYIASEETMTNEMLRKDRLFLTRLDRFTRFYLMEGWPARLDWYSRFAFPLAFILFNILYWVSTGD